MLAVFSGPPPAISGVPGHIRSPMGPPPPMPPPDRPHMPMPGYPFPPPPPGTLPSSCRCDEGLLPLHSLDLSWKHVTCIVAAGQAQLPRGAGDCSAQQPSMMPIAGGALGGQAR